MLAPQRLHGSRLADACSVGKWQASIGLMIVGAILAGATDLSFSLPGYVYVTICAVSTAVYLILIRFIQDRTRKCLLPAIWNCRKLQSNLQPACPCPYAEVSHMRISSQALHRSQVSRALPVSALPAAAKVLQSGMVTVAMASQV